MMAVPGFISQGYLTLTFVPLTAKLWIVSFLLPVLPNWQFSLRLAQKGMRSVNVTDPQEDVCPAAVF